MAPVPNGDRVRQRAGDQLGAQVVGGGVADRPPRGDVDGRGGVEPTFPGRDEGHVAAPAGVELGSVGGGVPTDAVGSRRGGRSGTVVFFQRYSVGDHANVIAHRVSGPHRVSSPEFRTAQ